MSIHEAVLTIGQILGSVVGGAVYQGSSWSRVFVLAAGLSLIFIPLQLGLSRRR
jgi:predicted MFS family arabinose efflux permease